MWFMQNNNSKEFIKISDKQFRQRYRVVQVLGTGTYGQVSKAQSNSNNFVAIKRFKPQAVQHFHCIIRQISNLKRLDHPNILKFYDCYIVEDKYYMVTQFCSGGSLTDIIPKLKQDRIRLSICRDISQGLSYAHSQGIVHRDLKPQNILIGDKSIAKIGDFGCSTKIENNQVMTSRVGSPAYMDDRVEKRLDYDNTADIYSLGMIFICIYKGKGIYDECKTMTELQRYKSQIYRDYDNNIQKHIEALPYLMKQIVKNCLNPDYEQRYTAKEIAQKIDMHLSTIKQDLVSTLDEFQSELQTQSNNFACNLLAKKQYFDYKHKCQETRNQLFRILQANKKQFQKIINIQRLKYINSDTKAQFSFLIILYYHYWLQQMMRIISSENSQLKNRYQLIDPNSIQQQVMNQAEAFIRGQMDMIYQPFYKCSIQIQSTIRFLGERKYLPERFKEWINNISQKQNIDFRQISLNLLKSNIKSFFQKRILKQYEYQRGNEPHDQKLEIIRTIYDSFI